MPDYSAWPTTTDVNDVLATAGVTPRSSTRLPSLIVAVAAQITRFTMRQFVADTADTTRIYDGQGVAEQEVDEMVSLTGVSVLTPDTTIAYALTNASLVSEQGKPQTRIIVGRGSVPAFQTAAIWTPYLAVFPAGRLNILVTGKFGFGATIPIDLWNAAAEEVAARLVRPTIFDPAGRVKKLTRGDVSKEYGLTDDTVLGWHENFMQMLAIYKRRSGRRLRNLRPRMM